VLEDIVLLNTIGIRVVLVHGGGPEINTMLERVGKKSKFIDGLRYTDAETMEIVQMVLNGKLNKEIVAILLKLGGRAVGISGVDAGLLYAKKIDKNGVDLGFVGEVTRVNPQIIVSLLSQGFIPVVSTVALGDSEYETEETADPGLSKKHSGYAVYNINADTAAAKIAVALKAEKFVQLTNVPGVLRNVQDPSTLIKRIAREALPSMIATGIISEGMIPKIECCLEALKGGVPRTHIIDGRVPHSLLIEMFSDRGVGTMIL
jgi:acetylglutamate kinase